MLGKHVAPANNFTIAPICKEPTFDRSSKCSRQRGEIRLGCIFAIELKLGSKVSFNLGVRATCLASESPLVVIGQWLLV